MRRYLPFIVLGLGLVVVVVAFFVLRSRGDGGVDEDGKVPEVSLGDRPIASLIPSEDGHWLKMKVEKISVKGVQTLDYELLYQVADGRTQGVPGSIKLDGKKEIERDLLLGSESAGKFRYDESVETGSFTLKLRDGNGKLVAKFTTDFHMQSNVKVLTTIDGDFKYDTGAQKDVFFVTMETFGVPELPSGSLKKGPFGVFRSSNADEPGKVDLSGDIYRWNGDGWVLLDDGDSSDVGIFCFHIIKISHSLNLRTDKNTIAILKCCVDTGVKIVQNGSKW